MLESAKKVLRDEAEALIKASERLDERELEGIINLILSLEGKFIVMGVGKSGHIGAKIAATLASTGTPSFFIHPTEALHGDLGMIESKDVVLAISFSGESDELKMVLPHIKRIGAKIITMTKNPKSSVSLLGDYFLSLEIDREACPLNTAPTTSTTLTLALGDMLAVCLMKARGFTHQDFASFHPGGALGKRLFVKIKDLMQRDNLPFIDTKLSLKDAVVVMSEARLGNAIVLEGDKVLGVLSDGDLRRAMMRSDFDFERPAFEYATLNPKTCDNENLLAYDVLKIMEESKIQLLIITDKEKRVLGVLHLHTLIEAGIQ